MSREDAVTGLSPVSWGCHTHIPQLKPQMFMLGQGGGWKSKTKVLAGLGPSQASFLPASSCDGPPWWSPVSFLFL